MRNPDLERDLIKSDWIVEKAIQNKSYAQNIYAALCNMQWQKLEVFPILKEELWSCTWRYSGGVVARLLGEGDYIDWYCSGMGGLADYDTDSEEWQARTGYVPEGTVTEEIRTDFQKLGWIPVPYKD